MRIVMRIVMSTVICILISKFDQKSECSLVYGCMKTGLQRAVKDLSMAKLVAEQQRDLALRCVCVCVCVCVCMCVRRA